MTTSTARSNGTTAPSVSSVSDITLHQENLNDVFVFELDTVVDEFFPEEEISFETQPSTALDTSTLLDNNPVKAGVNQYHRNNNVIHSSNDNDLCGRHEHPFLELHSLWDVIHSYDPDNLTAPTGN